MDEGRMRSMHREHRSCLPDQTHGHDPDTLVGTGRRCGWYDHADFIEATLSELFEDPLIRRLMTSDGVDPAELRALLAELGARRAQRAALPGQAGRI
jgi:hypothetical protein